MPLAKRLCYNKDMTKKSRGGFTLIELSLSLIFIALLSLAVVFLIQNLVSSYQRGLVLNQVNTVGMDLIDDFRISIQNANSEPITKICERRYPFVSKPDNPSELDPNSNRGRCIKDNANSFIVVTKYGSVNIDGAVSNDIPIYGAFCTGTFTYIWNTGYFDNSDAYNDIDKRSVNPNTKAELKVWRSPTDKGLLVARDFKLLKVYDDSRSVCVHAMEEQNGGSDEYLNYGNKNSWENRNNVNNVFYIDGNMWDATKSKSEGGAVELLKKNDKYSNLALYNLYVAPPAISITRENIYYAASFILGTIRGGINIRATGNNCRPSNDNKTDLNYCAINKFNFGVTAGGS